MFVYVCMSILVALPVFGDEVEYSGRFSLVWPHGGVSGRYWVIKE